MTVTQGALRRPPIARQRAVVAGLLAALFILATVGVLAGVGGLPSPSLVVSSRLPRVLAAVLTGAGLAVAGLIMQSLARNRFVEPMTAGAGQAAALGILAVTLAAPEASIAIKFAVAASTAFAGTLLFLMLARRLPPTEPFLVPLVGIVYGGVLAAIGAAIAWHFDLLQYLYKWLSGEFTGILAGRYELLWLVAILCAGGYALAEKLTIVSLGRDAARGLGLAWRSVLALGLFVVSCMTALTVVTVGIIPFVGLVVPALASRIMGDNVHAALPLVGLGGAVLVLACDLTGRFVRFPYEVPVGTVLGVVGAFAFLIVVATRRG